MELFATSHRQVYRNIHNFLAGRFIGATRERALLNEVIKCLFCRVYLINNDIGIDESLSKNEIYKLYNNTFKNLKVKLVDVFDEDDEILLDDECINFFDKEIRHVDLSEIGRDPFGDLFEIFIGTGVREEEGQFFTPKNGIEFLVSLVNPIFCPVVGKGATYTLNNSDQATHLLSGLITYR